eukprot:6532457-Pyramimonas_sp.AAC.1
MILARLGSSWIKTQGAPYMTQGSATPHAKSDRPSPPRWAGTLVSLAKASGMGSALVLWA